MTVQANLEPMGQSSVSEGLENLQLNDDQDTAIAALRLISDGEETSPTESEGQEITGFSSTKRTHILNCSFHSWYPKYRSITPKTRLIPLSAPFLKYLRADGIILPDDEGPRWAQRDGENDDSEDDDTKHNKAGEDDDEEKSPDITTGWHELHEKIRSTIAELGGVIYPKLNWSAPKDATWISSTHTMECHSPSDVYLLLKSSDFVTHDLENVWDDTVDDLSEGKKEYSNTNNQDVINNPDSHGQFTDGNGVPYHLILRKPIKTLNPALEFRCFVKARELVGISQRDQNYYSFLFKLRPQLTESIKTFFKSHLSDTFPDDDFVFDVYIPMPYDRVWLVDVNPWAARTDSLMFDWTELLTGIGLSGDTDEEEEDDEDYEVVDLTTPDSGSHEDSTTSPTPPPPSIPANAATDSYDPFFRLIRKTDPESYNFSTSQYSAHKLPKDVVDASSELAGQTGMAGFAAEWFREIEQREKQRKAGKGSVEESDSE